MCTNAHMDIPKNGGEGRVSSSIALHFIFKLLCILSYCGDILSILYSTRRTGVHRGRKRVLDFLELELQMI